MTAAAYERYSSAAGFESAVCGLPRHIYFLYCTVSIWSSTYCTINTYRTFFLGESKVEVLFTVRTNFLLKSFLFNAYCKCGSNLAKNSCIDIIPMHDAVGQFVRYVLLCNLRLTCYAIKKSFSTFFVLPALLQMSTE